MLYQTHRHIPEMLTFLPDTIRLWAVLDHGSFEL